MWSKHAVYRYNRSRTSTKVPFLQHLATGAVLAYNSRNSNSRSAPIIKTRGHHPKTKWYKPPKRPLVWVPNPKEPIGSNPGPKFRTYPAVGTDSRRSHRTHKKAKRTIYKPKKKRTLKKGAVKKYKRKM